MIKAIFFDLDRTLLDCDGGKDRFSDRDLLVFGRIKQRGIRLFVATGRSVSFIPPFVKAAGFDGFVLVNGASVWVEGLEIARHVLPAKQMEVITGRLWEERIEYALQIPGGTWISRDRSLLLPHFRKYLFDEGHLIEKDLSACLQETMKLELFVYPKKYALCQELLKELKYTWDPKTNTMEAYAKTVSKATGAKEILGYLGLEPEECMCFGDDYNDLELSRLAGWSVAMENGIRALKDQADDVCGRAVQDGVAQYLEKALGSNIFNGRQSHG